jgi:hypothetical protein
MEPGEYYLAATPPPGRGRTSEGSYLRTYYPGVGTLDAAQSVRVSEQQQTTVDLAMTPREVFVVSGTLDSPAIPQPSAPLAKLFLAASPQNGMQEASPVVLGSVGVRANRGTFMFDDVPAGSYELIAVSEVSPGRTLTARAPIQVVNRNIEASLFLREGIDVKGEVVLGATSASSPSGGPVTRGGATRRGAGDMGPAEVPPQFSALTIVLIPIAWMPPAVNRRNYFAAVSENGSFVLPNIAPGAYMLEVSGLLMAGQAYIEEIRGAGITRESPVLRVEESVQDLMIVVSNPGRQVGGTVQTNGVAVPGASVMLAPTAPFEKDHQRYQTTKTDVLGRFAFLAVAPGDYKVFAAESFPAMASMHPELLTRFVVNGKAVNIQPGATPGEIMLPLLSEHGEFVR